MQETKKVNLQHSIPKRHQVDVADHSPNTNNELFDEMEFIQDVFPDEVLCMKILLCNYI